MEKKGCRDLVFVFIMLISRGCGINCVTLQRELSFSHHDMEAQRIKNIIFDLGGVICDLLPEVCHREFSRLGCDSNIFPTQYSQFEGIFQKIDRGTMSIPDFLNAMRTEGGIQATDQQICDAWNSLIGPIPDERFRAFKQLKDTHNIYILSNTNDIHWGYVDKKCLYFEGEHVTPWFKHAFRSYDMHLEKPEREIYQAVLDTAQINPDETLFIDDNQPNLDAAAQLGIHTLLTKGGDWVMKLREMGILA